MPIHMRKTAVWHRDWPRCQIAAISRVWPQEWLELGFRASFAEPPIRPSQGRPTACGSSLCAAGSRWGDDEHQRLRLKSGDAVAAEHGVTGMSRGGRSLSGATSAGQQAPATNRLQLLVELDAPPMECSGRAVLDGRRRCPVHFLNVIATTRYSTPKPCFTGLRRAASSYET